MHSPRGDAGQAKLSDTLQVRYLICDTESVKRDTFHVSNNGDVCRSHSPQLRNLERAMNGGGEQPPPEQPRVKVCDRTALILDIFSQRAATREGKLQVRGRSCARRGGGRRWCGERRCREGGEQGGAARGGGVEGGGVEGGRCRAGSGEERGGVEGGRTERRCGEGRVEGVRHGMGERSHSLSARFNVLCNSLQGRGKEQLAAASVYRVTACRPAEFMRAKMRQQVQIT